MINGQAAAGSEPDGQVFPGLVPVQWFARQVVLGGDGDDLLAVMVELRTPTGIHITFWPEDTAVGFAARLLELAQATAEGVVSGAEG